MKLTQKEKIIKMWVDKQVAEPTRWFYPYELIGEGTNFVGYKAPTRFSELCLEFPQLIESKIEGKFRIARLKLDQVSQVLPTLPLEFRYLIRARVVEAGLPLTEKKLVPIYSEDGRSVRLVEKEVTINGRD